MKSSDIRFYEKNMSFHFRTRAVIIKDRKILMVLNTRPTKYYYSVGGHVEVGETSVEAVKRETFEETGLHLEVDKLLFIEESFYVKDSKKYHDIVFYYLMAEMEEGLKLKNMFNDIGEKLKWLSIDDLGENQKYPVHPSFYKNELSQLSNEIKHFTSYNEY